MKARETGAGVDNGGDTGGHGACVCMCMCCVCHTSVTMASGGMLIKAKNQAMETSMYGTGRKKPVLASSIECAGLIASA